MDSLEDRWRDCYHFDVVCCIVLQVSAELGGGVGAERSLQRRDLGSNHLIALLLQLLQSGQAGRRWQAR